MNWMLISIEPIVARNIECLKNQMFVTEKYKLDKAMMVR